MPRGVLESIFGLLLMQTGSDITGHIFNFCFTPKIAVEGFGNLVKLQPKWTMNDRGGSVGIHMPLTLEGDRCCPIGREVRFSGATPVGRSKNSFGHWFAIKT